MPRPREFDEDAALNAAMECFWSRGFAATSLRDLTGAMKVTAPSLYNAFGDKEALFRRTLAHYLERGTRDRLRRLEQELPPRQAIEQFFKEIIEHSVKDRQRKGCFLVNSALEIAPHDEECRALIAEQFENIEGFFRGRVVAGQGEGSISPELDAGDMARLLLGTLLGIRVLARTKPRGDLLEGLARPALALLHPLHGKKKSKR
ncbi:MAG TPA: TetR/AcrR family transcriptional regulator [Xanthobacteraceae bacterium]|jgi:TetR/AcrR family transcriptional repressor of nem operon|nr:TetR/AcrR family transcriptional regulator [Xanthobacteraceae bacterium]